MESAGNKTHQHSNNNNNPLLRTLVENVLLDVVSVQHNEELLTVELELMISPRYFPSFILPVTSRLYFEDLGEGQKIYK